MTHRYRTALPYVALALMPLFYSSNLIIGRAAIAETSPVTLAFFRWLLATAMVLPLAMGATRQTWFVLRGAWRTILLLGFLGMVMCGAGVYVSLQWTTATNATLIYTTSPALIVLIEWLFAGRAVNRIQLLGLATACLGIATIVLRGELQRLLALDFNLGDIGIAVAALSWALYSVILRREGLGNVPVLSSFAAISVAGTLCLFPFFLLELATTADIPTTKSAWLSIAALALIPSVLAFSFFQYGVQAVGASKAGAFLYALPLYGVFLAVIFLGEAFEAYHVAGLILVTGGIAMATLPTPRKRTKPPI